MNDRWTSPTPGTPSSSWPPWRASLLVKEYFGLTVGQTLKSWSVMETAISVVGLVCVLVLNVFV